MPRGNKKVGERRRKVCTCKAFNCKSGVYLDAQGLSQQGVELSPEAYEAHQQSELRNIAQAATSDAFDAHSFQDINLGSLSQDNHLVEILRELRVSPASQPSPSGSGEAADVAQVPDRSSREHHEDVILESSRTCPAIDTAREGGIEVYNTTNFFTFNLRQVNPVCLHVALTTAIISIFEHASMFTASWLLDAQRITIELALTHGLLPNVSPGQLEPLQAKVLNQIPRTVDTVIGWLEIDPCLQFVNCCKGCFAMYPLASAPKRCTHRVAVLPGAPSISEDPEDSGR
ncbi:uncharacterized protein MELLADRAFT_108954 [Melampsora larici-populina 98AG31]|uniref:Uncharacterized protein n=1 Tax=Melampsora larici-populina (strain 98AG31 / pathotype 3-4-7) TaxID=747676 RepID=F4RUV1_MELLP|nr:uncharacterized protein MELLADRAFT_108954 [Melampsora larici-populina 98AG31]EGG03859.1 hypothetical protein MELLADRAFT_108954 [Melampsora larici-populina 98AG31]